VLVYALLGVIFRGHPRAQSIYGNIGLLLPAIVFCVVVLRRRPQCAGAHRLFWDAFLVGMILWSLGHIGWAFSDVVWNRPAWVQWHTMFSLCGGIGPLVALIARPHLGVRRDAVGATAIDLISYGMLIAFVYAYFVLVPSVVMPIARTEPVLLALVQTYRLVLVIALASSAWAARRTPWRFAFTCMLAGASAGFFLRILTSFAIASRSYHSGTLFDLAWIIPYLSYVVAAIEAPASLRAEDTRDEKLVEAPSGVLSAMPMLLVPIIGYGLLRIQPLGDAGDSFRVLLTTMATVAGVGLLAVRLAVQRDELHRADARLRLLAAAVEQTRDLILITRPDGAFEHANEACVRALGYTRAELSRMALSDLFEEPPDGSRISSEVRQNGVWRGTLVHRRHDGSTFPVSSTVVGLRNDDGWITHFVGVQRDITEELRLRDQLVHSERMSAVGELVAGVAHEINNPLQTIVGCVELLLEEQGSPADQQRDLQLVRREAARAGQIVRNLLAFVRRGSPERALGSLNQIVKATADLREYHLAQNSIHLVMDLHSSALAAQMNREEIQQVVLNLVLNAEQAIVKGTGRGTISIRTTTDGVFHRLQVTDDGPGVSPELRGRIFEPFFTTKDVGEGTGLGLSISLGIATAHGGALTLVETPRGACFELRLPAAAQAAVAPPQLDAREKAGLPRVLIVEDEAAIRSLLSRLLARRGFQAVEAASVPDALAQIDARSFGLVLCDIALGHDSGVIVYRHAQARRPDIAPRFVFVTGDAGSVPGDADLASVPILAKPFTAADLDRVLEHRSTGAQEARS
jgi:two-component system NtrC family sensor kinase